MQKHSQPMSNFKNIYLMNMGVISDTVSIPTFVVLHVFYDARESIYDENLNSCAVGYFKYIYIYIYIYIHICIYIYEMKLTFEMLTVRGQQH